VSDNDLIQEARRFGGEWGRALADRLEAANARVARIERLLEHVDAARAGYDALVARANRLEKGLVVLYRSHPVDVARVCDEVIDRRGGLLGRIRALAGVSAEPATETRTLEELLAAGEVERVVLLPEPLRFPTAAEPATEEKCGSFGCVLPKGHNTGRADIPENHVSSVSAGAVKALIADASEPFLVPDVTPRGASKAAVFHVLRDMVDAGALEHHVDGYRRPNAAASAGVGQVPADTIKRALRLAAIGSRGIGLCVGCHRVIEFDDDHRESCLVAAALAAVRTPEEQTEKPTCPECGRDLHGYRGPLCRYCDGTAE
jgi:hypothetical protein